MRPDMARGLPQRFLAGQAEAAHAALVVVDDQALQHVVDLVERDGELEVGVAVDRRLVLEVAEAAGRQHHALERQVLGKGRERNQAHQRHDQPAHVISPMGRWRLRWLPSVTQPGQWKGKVTLSS
jgi:hypothetical protein